MSDAEAIDYMRTEHNYRETKWDTVVAALTAGVNLELSTKSRAINQNLVNFTYSSSFLFVVSKLNCNRKVAAKELIRLYLHLPTLLPCPSPVYHCANGDRPFDRQYGF